MAGGRLHLSSVFGHDKKHKHLHSPNSGSAKSDVGAAQEEAPESPYSRAGSPFGGPDSQYTPDGGSSGHASRSKHSLRRFFKHPLGGSLKSGTSQPPSAAPSDSEGEGSTAVSLQERMKNMQIKEMKGSNSHLDKGHIGSKPFLESGIAKYGKLGRVMGSGAGGNVRIMERPHDSKFYAVKEFRPRRANESKQDYTKHVTAEYCIGATLHHPNIIETMDLVKEGNKFYEIMEFGPYDFFSCVMSGDLTRAQIGSAFKQLCSAVTYLHDMGLAHRDLKLDNCVLSNDGILKIIDFGSAVVFQYPFQEKITLAKGVVGSDPYLAPEVLTRKPYDPRPCDVWSCGIIFCCLSLRRFPWKIATEADTSYSMYCADPDNVDGTLQPEVEDKKTIKGPWRLLRLLPSGSRPLIHRILTVNIQTRATLRDIAEDEWFKEQEDMACLFPPGYESMRSDMLNLAP